MNQEIGTEWVGRLRSKRYKQGTTYLRHENEYCCLGVLCEMAVEAGVIEGRERIMPDPYNDGQASARYEYGSSTAGWAAQFLPRAVQEWAGLDESPTVNPPGVWWTEDPDLDLDGISLAGLNDRGETFETIAGLIEIDLLRKPVPA